MALTPVQEGAASTLPAHHPTMLSEAGNGISSPVPDLRADTEARAGPLGRIAAMLVAISLRRPILTLAISALFGIAACWVLATRFALDTDTMRMFPEDLPWRRTEKAINAAFPQRADVITVVVDGATPDVAEHAAVALTQDLQRASKSLRSVTRPDAEVFFRRNALLFLDESALRTTTEQIISAQPMLGTLATDPSLRGVARTLVLAAKGIEIDKSVAEKAQLASALAALGNAAEGASALQIAPLDWSRLFTGREPVPLAMRRFVLVQPVLDYTSLAPASAAITTIRETAARLGLTPENGVRVRLTGDPVIRDEEFSMVFSGAISENILSLLSVAALLWLGLRSMRLILPMLLVLILGLVVTAAFGALFIGPYNPLSIAFAVMFIGLAVDFAIQYSVCLREQRHRLRSEPLSSALVTAAAIAGPGIGLAALALCAGFLAFLPTDYRGLSELGIIASAGMMIGVIASLTTLPALLILSRPQEEEQPVGYAALAPLDRFLTRRARGVAVATGVLALAAAACLPFLHFDSNPLNLRNPTTEAVSTFRDLMSDLETTPNTIQSLVPDLGAAQALAARLDAVPEVSGTRTLIDFVPKDQAAKLALIHDTAELLGPTLEPPVTEPPPKSADTTRAFAAASAALLHAAAGERADPLLVAPASRLGIALRVLAEGPPAALDRLHSALIPGLVTTLDVLRTMLDARQITLADLPDSLRRDWIAPTGLARVEVRPRDLSDHYDAMARFSQAVLAVAPGASGLAVIVQGGARTIGDAFLRAGVIATALTLFLLLAALRSWRLAVLALAPLALAGLLTLATCVAMGLPLNFANVIALPLLFAQGVAFDIYYVAAWRSGMRTLLPSALTRAVLYSALTNGTAFGTLALSQHPGMAGMGVMLTVSLLYALAAVILTLPPLLVLFAGQIGDGRRCAD